MNTISLIHKISLFILLIICTFCSTGQTKYYTKTAKINFYSQAPLENIEAVNKTAIAIVDSNTGDVQFSVLVKGFEFEKALMQEHFNENYLESSKYPKSQFSGKIQNNGVVNYSKDGAYTASVKGTLTLHGVAKEITVPGNTTVKNGIPVLQAEFYILLSDYNISIPSLVKDKISKTVRITIDCTLSNRIN